MTPLRKQVGHLLIAGLEGTSLTALERSWLKVIQPSGVILFRRNIDEAEQTYKLLAEAGSFSAAPLFRCVDLEGGLVDRLRDLIAPMPSLAAVASSGKKASFLKHGKLIGREAGLLGFNVVLAPVLDLALQESRPVMRTRSFFAGPEEVIAYTSAFLDGLEATGVLGCGKHFPGLGGGTLDSHRATPVIGRSAQDLWNNDLLPYRSLKSRLPMVMISHASYPASGDSGPASISPYWITDVLKKRIGYRGLVLSDDMEMGGILTRVSIEDAAVQAVAGGTHLVEVCRDPALLLRAFEALLSEAERSVTFRRIVEAASRKVVRARQSIVGTLPRKPPSLSQIEKLRAEIGAFRERLPRAATESAQ